MMLPCQTQCGRQQIVCPDLQDGKSCQAKLMNVTNLRKSNTEDMHESTMNILYQDVTDTTPRISNPITESCTHVNGP